MNLDVEGYVLKENAQDEILSCMRAVVAGDYYCRNDVFLSAQSPPSRRELDRSQPGVKDLTTAERRILLHADNRTAKEIAAEFLHQPAHRGRPPVQHLRQAGTPRQQLPASIRHSASREL
jgi:DNA-binding NarL/FixJ family response regulator